MLWRRLTDGHTKCSIRLEKGVTMREDVEDTSLSFQISAYVMTKAVSSLVTIVRPTCHYY